jgi:hypothetical protein
MDKNKTLVHTEGNIIIRIDLESKNSHKFEDGTVIRIERGMDNFNRKYTEVVNGIVISGKGIPAGSEILIHHNATHDTYRIFDYQSISREHESVKYFSIPEDQCFFYRETEDSEWQPIGGFIKAYRVFDPYEGLIEGIPPKEIKKALYIVSGELAGKVCHTLHACDYMVEYMHKGRMESLIRCRHFEGEDLNDREEIIAISDYLTEKLESNKLWYGLEAADAKPLNQLINDSTRA